MSHQTKRTIALNAAEHARFRAETDATESVAGSAFDAAHDPDGTLRAAVARYRAALAASGGNPALRDAAFAEFVGPARDFALARTDALYAACAEIKPPHRYYAGSPRDGFFGDGSFDR